MPDHFHQIILYQDKGILGGHQHVFRSLGEGFGGISSFVVTGGVWQAYLGSNFLQPARGSLFCPRIRGYSWVEDYQIPNDQMCSVELVGDDPRMIPHIILFSQTNFNGSHWHVFAEQDNSNWPFNVQSVAILSGIWNLTGSGSHAKTVTLGPGTYATLGGVGGVGLPSSQLLQSVAIKNPVSRFRDMPDHLIIFDNKDFDNSGSHQHIFGSMTNPPSFGISSLAVEKGDWQMYANLNFFSPTGPILTRGIYPWVEDLEITNDSIKTIKLTTRPTNPALISISHANDGKRILTAKGDNYRLGWNRFETSLTPGNVRLPYFGRIWQQRMTGTLATPDGNPAKVYSQPLYVKLRRKANTMEAVIVGTANNDVVALNASDGSVIWQTNLGVPLSDSDFGAGLNSSYCGNISPWHGISSTPVIDPTGKIIYVAFITKVSANAATTPSQANNFNQVYMLQALNVADGSTVWNSPVKLEGVFAKINVVPFLPYVHTQRAALTYVPGKKKGVPDTVLVPFSSRCDSLSSLNEDWQGWIIAVNVSQNPPPAPNVFATAQDTTGLNGCGGIWGTGGLSVDNKGQIYAATGNGPWNGLTNFPDSAIRLASATDLTITDFYTAHDWNTLFNNDYDLGGSSPVLLPPQTLGPAVTLDSAPSINPVVFGGKDGRVYILDANKLGNMGGNFANQPDSLGHPLWRPQVYGAGGDPYTCGIAVTGAYFDAGERGKFVYFASASSNPHLGLVAVKFDDLNGETMLGTRIIQFAGDTLQGAPGSPFVSSNRKKDGIVWAVESKRLESDDAMQNSILHAWDAVTGRLLYSSPATTSQLLGNGRKFLNPIVINGRVFVPADGVVCYGLKLEDS